MKRKWQRKIKILNTARVKMEKEGGGGEATTKNNNQVLSPWNLIAQKDLEISSLLCSPHLISVYVCVCVCFSLCVLIFSAYKPHLLHPLYSDVIKAFRGWRHEYQQLPLQSLLIHLCDSSAWVLCWKGAVLLDILSLDISLILCVHLRLVQLSFWKV